MVTKQQSVCDLTAAVKVCALQISEEQKLKQINIVQIWFWKYLIILAMGLPPVTSAVFLIAN
jgi:hypothetical protein